jgi:peptide/nickel transport system permease protein
MTAFIIRRLLGMIPTLFAVSLITFVIIQLPPGDFMTSLQAQVAATGSGLNAEALDALRQRYGLDQPLVLQYLRWIAGFPRGDFGYSMEWNAPVWDLVASRFAFTILLGGLAMIVMWVISIPIGVYSATHQYSLGDNVFTFLGFVGLSIPDFMLALIYLVFVTLVLGWSAAGLYSPGMESAPWSIEKVLDLLNHLWAPVLILAFAGTAELMRIMRGNMLDVLSHQHITTARAKGLRERLVINKYAVRVAINPLISVLGMQIPKLISSSIIIGVVLSIPTIGPMFLRSLISQDMYLAGFILLAMTVLLLIGNLMADIGLAWADPRIRLE